MSPEELLIPRYIVCADWPGNKMLLGTILHLNRVGKNGRWHCFTEDEPVHIDDGDNKYPAVLRLLKWWEYRNPGELTGYIKIRNDYHWLVYEIDITDTQIMKWKFGARDRDDFFPATEAEYIIYKQKQ